MPAIACFAPKLMSAVHYALNSVLGGFVLFTCGNGDCHEVVWMSYSHIYLTDHADFDVIGGMETWSRSTWYALGWIIIRYDLL
jgi:hypothetical protein